MTFVCFFAGKGTVGIDGTDECEPVYPDDYCAGCERHICFLGEVPKDFKLATVAEHFGAPVEKAHDALSDVRTTVALMRRFRDIFVGAKAAA